MSSYIGRGIDQIDNISTLDNLSFNGSDTVFNLTQNSVAFNIISVSALQIQIDGIIQVGNFTQTGGSQITFDFTPNSGSVCNSIKHFGVGLLTTVSDGAITEAKIGSGAVTSSKIASGVIPTFRPNANPLIINGDMAVAQRGTSATGKSSSGYYTCDRFKLNPDSLGTWTVTQESLTSGNAYNNGFRKAFRIDCTTADASPSASDNLSLFQRLEGQDLQLFKKGTANAEKFTLAFWVKSNKTGTSQVNLRDGDNTRMVSATYSISTTNTWEHKVLNFPADTTGAFDNDNANSLQIEWFLDSGTDYSSGTAPTTWEASSNADRNANNLDVGGSTDNDFAITGIQLEVGEYTSSTLPPFQHESYADNLARCYRYYYKLIPVTGFRFVGWCQVDNDDTNHVSYIDFKVDMRIPPTALEQSGTASHYKIREATTITCDAVPTFNNADTWYAQISFKKSSSGFSQGEILKCGIDGGYLAWSAEL